MPARRQIPEDVQNQVRQRANYLCEYCHASEQFQYVAFTIEHVIPLNKNGADKLLGDAPRLVAIYGGNPEDWDKMTSNQAFEINGASVQVYWVRNSQTLQDVEFKFKRQYPKTAPKNL